MCMLCLPSQPAAAAAAAAAVLVPPVLQDMDVCPKGQAPLSSEQHVLWSEAPPVLLPCSKTKLVSLQWAQSTDKLFKAAQSFSA
jgi:hypothetical protein